MTDDYPVSEHAPRQLACIVVFAIAFLLGSASPTFAQKDAKPPKEFKVSYDKFQDETAVVLMDFDRILFFDVWFRYKGEAALSADVTDFYITFRTPGRCSGFCFYDPQLIFLIDGERLPFPAIKTLSDIATFPLTRDTIERISKSKKVEYQVGRYQGELKTTSFAKFKTLLELGTKK